MNYIILGMGYISNKHLQAIKETGGNLVAYHDISDVVGHVDSFFIDALYYPDFMHLDCFVDRFQHSGQKIDYAVILLPNHLHNPACRWALNRGMDVIVEKPLVLNERNLDELAEMEQRTGRKINTILQMRLHESAKAMRGACDTKTSFVNIEYSTPRGNWFKHGSWKADPHKTGGIPTAIGIHLFDLCSDMFGEWLAFAVHKDTGELIEGNVSFERAMVEWSLSIEAHKKPQRVFKVNDTSYDFTQGFSDLHTESYSQILSGAGFGIEDARSSIQLAEAIRNAS